MSEAVPGEEKVSRRRPWLFFALSLAVLAGVIYFGGMKYLEAQDDLNDARAEAQKASLAETTAVASNHVLQDRLKGMEEQLAQAREEKTAIASEKDALAEDLEKKEAEIARLRATYDKLNDKLQSEIKKGEILLTEANGKIRVDLVDKVLFDSGQADLSPRGQEVLTRVAAVLKDVDDKMIQVSGHTDDSPITDKLVARYPTNWELSVARAVNVVRFLSEQGKVSSKRLEASGFGEFHPVASNSTASGRAANRRIEILLTPEVEKPAKQVFARTEAKKAPAQTKVVKADAAKKPTVKVASSKTTAKKK